MQADIAGKLGPLADLCRGYGVARLEVFGSAARELDFDPRRSDFDFLVEFERRSDLPPLEQFFGFAEALEQLLGRPVDLVEREALEASRNFIRRRAILSQAERVLWLNCLNEMRRFFSTCCLRRVPRSLS